MARVIVNGTVIGECRDDFSECPEDAIWGRDLEEIFDLGVKAGMMANQLSDIVVDELTEIY